MSFNDMDMQAVNEIRALCADIVQGPNSGHPGAPIGMSPMAYVLFKNHIRLTPKTPFCPARDRFVLSNGHASALLYSMLHLTGFDYTMEDLKQFRKMHSKTPGHPERCDFHSGKVAPGIELTSGPLGQGIASAVGLAISMEALKPYDKENVIVDDDSRVYVFCGDGCLQEGVASEACSLAGTKKLNRLIVLYDDNGITIDGKTEISFAENVQQRFEAYGWNVLTVQNGNTDLAAIDNAIIEAKKSDKPTLIKVKTIIGYGAPKQDTHSVHGSPLGAEGLVTFKKFYNLPADKSYHISEQTREIFAKITARYDAFHETYLTRLNASSYKTDILHRFDFVANLTPEALLAQIQPKLAEFITSGAKKATRQTSQAAIQLLSDTILKPFLIIGSADLAPSCLTTIQNLPTSQYIHFGVREFAMTAISNGIASFGAFIPFDATFLVFFNYCAGAIRLGALSRLQAIHVFTHDSISLGEDGGTHQPVETLAQIRALPGVYDWRPADAAETVGAYCGAAGRRAQHVFALSRSGVGEFESSAEKTAQFGAYCCFGGEGDVVTVLSSGTEVAIAVEVAKKMKNVRVVSMPSFSLFMEQSAEYVKETMGNCREKCISFEPYVKFGLEGLCGSSLSIETYGLSGNAKDLAQEFGMTAERLEAEIRKMM